MPTAASTDRPTWRIRRRIIHVTLLLCALEIGYLTVWGRDTRLAETLATGAFLLAGAVIGSYVFGAAWEDIRFKQASRRDRYDDDAGGYDYGG